MQEKNFSLLLFELDPHYTNCKRIESFRIQYRLFVAVHTNKYKKYNKQESISIHSFDMNGYGCLFLYSST